MQHRLQRRGMVGIEVASTACSADQAAANREEIRVARTILDDELWRGHPGHAEAASKFDDRVAQLRFAMIAIHGDRALLLRADSHSFAGVSGEQVAVPREERVHLDATRNVRLNQDPLVACIAEVETAGWLKAANSRARSA